MIYDMIVRDHSDLLAKYNVTNRAKLILLIRSHQIGIPNAEYLKLPQHIKVQFRYPATMSLDDIKDDCRKKASQGSAMTCSIRKSWKYYCPKNHEDYYVERGVDVVVASEKAIAYRKLKSPYSKQFLRYRDLSESEISAKITELARNRGLLGLLSMRTGVSKLEQFVCDRLQHHGYVIQRQRQVGIYIYDIYIESLNRLIEVNGTYWHADPRVYSADEEVVFPYSTIPAKVKWQRDQKKIENAKNHNYTIDVIWEIDINQENFLDEYISRLRRD